MAATQVDPRLAQAVDSAFNTKAEMETSIDRFYRLADERTLGEDVPASDDGTLYIRVFPVKYEHLEPFIGVIQAMLADLIGRATDAESHQITQDAFIKALGPAMANMLRQGSDMVSASCVAWAMPGVDDRAVDPNAGNTDQDKMNRWYSGGERFGQPDLRRVPVHVQAMCIAAWIRQSFIGERARPLAQMVEDLLSRTIGKRVKIADLWKQFWSSRDKASQKSTGASETAGPTEVGASPNGGGESVPVFDSLGSNSPVQDSPRQWPLPEAEQRTT